MGLKAFIFTKADEESRIISKQMSAPFPVSEIENIQQDISEGKDVCLSEEEKVVMESWLVDYNNWNENMANIDPIIARRHRDASINLSLILIGLPLYIFHWRIIKKETEEKEREKNNKDKN
jgi:hypothetical protein